MNNKFDEYKWFDNSKGSGRYYEGWKDALRNIVYLIENEYDVHQIAHFCRREYEEREG